MPPGGDGYFYFSTYLHVLIGEFGAFEIQINGEMLCWFEEYNSANNYGPAVCDGISYIVEGLLWRIKMNSNMLGRAESLQIANWSLLFLRARWANAIPGRLPPDRILYTCLWKH